MVVASPDPEPVPAYLASLNAEQLGAVMHGEEPLLIIAGAGSGKTNTIAHRVARLIVEGADPRRILLMTFSRRAASDMTSRVERIAATALGDKASILAGGLTWSGTFHAVGARLLREHASAIGLDPAFTIQDRGDSADLMNLVRHRLGFSRTEKRFPAKATCLAIYSRAVNAQAALPEVLGSAFPWCAEWEAELRDLFAGYVEAKQAGGVLDFDDLLLYWAAMCADPGLAAETGGRFDHILIDEYQDTNRLQSAILAALRPDGRGVTVVGDDAQSIYAFRAAEIRNILDFPGRFSPPARIATLERNYRSSRPILDAANAVIAESRERYAKTLWTDRAGSGPPRIVSVRDEGFQASYVCERILEARETGTALRSQAVLFRTSHHSGPLEVELTRRNIPFVKFGGLKFLDTAHVKDVLAVLRLAQNPRDRIAGFRALQLVPGVGPASAERILDAAADGTGFADRAVPARAREHWPAFAALHAGLRADAAGWPAEMDAVRAWYEPHLERSHEDAPQRRADILQLAQIAAGYPSRERFLTDLTLDPPSATSDEAGVPHRDEDYLILSTIHSAKGREWRTVFLLNCVDGCIPSDLGTGTTAETEEERRLLYVAMTRAKEDLHLVTPQRFHVHGQHRHGDRHVYAARTRFVPASILDRFELTSWPPPIAERDGGGPVTPVDLRERMLAMWR